MCCAMCINETAVSPSLSIISMTPNSGFFFCSCTETADRSTVCVLVCPFDSQSPLNVQRISYCTLLFSYVRVREMVRWERWLTNIVRVAGSQPVSTVKTVIQLCTRSPKKLWRSNSIFNIFHEYICIRRIVDGLLPSQLPIITGQTIV